MANRRAASAAVVPRHGRLKAPSTLGGALQFVAIAVVVILVSVGSIGGFAVWNTISSIGPGVHIPLAKGQRAPQVGSAPGEINLLLTGSDTRTNQAGFQDPRDLAGSSGTGNNDVTMVLHVSADHQHAAVISIPRDLLVSIPQCTRANGSVIGGASMAMFNTTLSRAGLGCTVATAEQLTGLNIQYAAEISFDGVIQMSDAVGGVTVCLATNIRDPYVGLNLNKGEQTISGAKALAFLRSRHGVGDGSDLGRISDQQLFLSSLMRKITSQDVLSNPLTMYNLANAAVKNMTLSDTLTAPTTMVAIALALKHISLSNIVFVQWPSASNPAYPGRVVPAEPASDILHDALHADKTIALDGKLGRATVTAPAGLATANPTSTPTAGATSKPTSSGSALVLPSDVTGQTAAQQTCAVGFLQKG